MIFRKESNKKQLDYINSLNCKLIEIKTFKKTRSNCQNALYWVCLDLIGKETGNTKEALHESIKEGFLGYRKEVVNEKVVYIPQSTKELTTEKFTELLQKVFLLAESLNVKLPELNEFGL
jgi:hypothetical protein